MSGDKCLFLLSFLLLCILNFVCSSFHAVEVLVSEPATLPCDIACPDSFQWTRFIPDVKLIAHCIRGNYIVEKDFQKRFTFTGNSKQCNAISLLITSTIYNDIGSYRCSCTNQTDEVKLKVFVPTKLTVKEQEDVTLPCYGDTRRDATDVKWPKRQQKLLIYTHESGNVSLGAGFQDRFTLSTGFQDGDLSLHITSVRLADAGLYQCSIHDESRVGDPRAVLLIVEANKTDVFPGVIVVLVAVTVAAVIGCVCCLRRNASN